MAIESRNRMTLAEAKARELLFAQAIESADVQGKLLTDAEREALDLRAVEMARRAAGAKGEVDVASALCERAAMVVKAVQKRSATLASLGEASFWRPWIEWGIPLAVLILGIATDRLANPHQIDLLSFPFFAVVLWNIVVYVFLIVELFRPKAGQPGLRWGALQRLVDGIPRTGWGRDGKLRAEVAGRFVLTWRRVTAALTEQRIKQLLHLSAAAWGAGIVLSMFVFGLKVRYVIGWEATFLSAEQLSRLLDLVFAPVAALLSIEPFTLAEIRGMEFRAGAASPLEHAQRWVYLYSGLLFLVVIGPRLVLAFAAWLRARYLERHVTIDLGDPYFQRLVDQLSPANVTLWLCVHRPEDKAALASALAFKLNMGVNGLLVDTGAAGDTLRLLDIPERLNRTEAASVWQKFLGRPADADPARDPALETGDVILHVVSDPADLDAETPPLHEYGKRVLILVNPRADADPNEDDSGLVVQCEVHSRHREYIAGVISFGSFGRAWPQERALLDLLASCLAASTAQGVARLVSAWDLRNVARFRSAMSVLAFAVHASARERQDVQAPPFSLRDMVSKAAREGRETARQDAQKAIAERLADIHAGVLNDLFVLHGIDPAAAGVVRQEHAGTYKFRSSVNAPQAGMAGAATGAAVGASVDLMTGGLTLGMAALLGGLVTGSAALIGAAWKNRDSPSGSPSVHLSDDDLQRLVEFNLRLYLAVIHFGRYGSHQTIDETRPEWSSEIVAAVELNKARFFALSAAARDEAQSVDSTRAFANAFEDVARRVLTALYPESRIRPS